MRPQALAPLLLLLAPAYALPRLSTSLESIRAHLLAPFSSTPSSIAIPLTAADPVHILHVAPPAPAFSAPNAHKRLKRRLKKRSGTRVQCTLSGPTGGRTSGGGGGSSGHGVNTTSPSSPASSAAPASPTITVNSTVSCQGPSASLQVTTGGGPNGQESWMNCGISSKSGWSPPYVAMDDIVTIDLDTAMSTVGTPFGACSQFTSYFESAGDQYGIPPIILASIALQESSCDASAMGAGSTAGLMQISQDKCSGSPGGNCLDPQFNIDAGAKYLADTVQQTGGNFLLALGYYNGWYLGMTVDEVLAVGQGQCCGCMQNLDYLQQSLNGWFVGKDAYAIGLGTWQNLAVCQ